jgi:putative endonuclease
MTERSEGSSWVYIMANRRNGTLYTGVTTDLARRAWEHREGLTPGFTKDYGVKRLVWFETYDRVIDAIGREKAIKRWRRAWKLALIEAENPQWRDLYETLS